MPIAQLIPSFNAGELSPLLDARTDIDKYASGCRELQNFITTPYGPNMRRPGTELGGEAKSASRKSILRPFVFSENDVYQMEIGEGYIRLWARDTFSLIEYGPQPDWQTNTGYQPGDFVTVSGLQYRCLQSHSSSVFAAELAAGRWEQVTIQEVFTSYTESDLPDLQYVQVNDLVYFCHPLHPPYMVTRSLVSGEVFFSGQDTTYDYPPFLEENTDQTSTLTPAPPVFGLTSISSSRSIFQTGHVGAFFRIGYKRTTNDVTINFTANGASPSIRVQGSWNLNTYGTWAGTVSIERSYDSESTWETIRSYISNSNRNISVGGHEIKDCLLRITVTNRTAGASSDYATLTPDDGIIHGLVKILDVGPTSATALVITPIPAFTATSFWSEGAWSNDQGFPRAISSYQDRIFYAGTYKKPVSVWGTRLDDFQNFLTGPNADDGLFFTIAADRQSIIQWLQSKDGFLHVGRQGSEGRLNASESTGSLSPSDIQWTPTTSYGSKHLPAVILNDALLFVQGQGRKVRALAQVPNTAAFSGQDVTILSEHITQGGIVEFAAQNLPDAILWCVRADGVLLGMSYDSLSSVVAWHRHQTKGTFESVSVVPGQYGDEVWFVVRRRLGAPGFEQTKRFVERFRPGWREAWENEEQSEWWYLDCAERVVGSGLTTTVEGFGHLAGMSVRVLADGADMGNLRVSDEGIITLPAPASIVTAGLSYESILRPMKLEAPQQNGTAQGRKARICRMVVRLLKTLGGEYSTDGVNYADIPFRAAQDALDQSPPVFSGSTGDLVDRGNHRDSAEVWLRQSAPMPFTVLSIVPKWSPSGD